VKAVPPAQVVCVPLDGCTVIAGTAFTVKVTGYTHPPFVQFKVMVPVDVGVNVPPLDVKPENVPLPAPTVHAPAVIGVGVMLSVFVPLLHIVAVEVALVYAMCVYVSVADVFPEHQLHPPPLNIFITAAVPVPVNCTVAPAVKDGPDWLEIV
jgi:hypothetical protein